MKRDYIEREAIISEFKRLTLGENSLLEKLLADGVYSVLETFPSADVAEVVHGRWVFGEMYITGQPVHCSVCGWGKDMVDRKMWLLYNGHKFCGNCGAMMDGEREEE